MYAIDPTVLFILLTGFIFGVVGGFWLFVSQLLDGMGLLK
jgi:uncharacterized membrane protein required for colicin V production